MALIYIAVATFVVVKNITLIPHIFSLIIENAFGIKEMSGGGVGATIMLGNPC